MTDASIPQHAGLAAGTPAYRHANLAMCLAGFATFAMLYGTQPLLPQIADSFQVGPSLASLSVTAGTAALAVLLIPMSLVSDRHGRGQVMKHALLWSTVFALASAASTDFRQLLLLRTALGVALAGLPTAAMAYLGEEIAPAARGRAMGLYIAGNALGGMCGRFLAALVSEWLSWRWGLAALGVLGAGATAVFWRMLPPAHHFAPRATGLRVLWRDTRAVFADAGLPWLFLTAFLIMGAFVGLYNYLGFRLKAPPYGLGPTAIGAVFLLYAIGSASSAWAGQLADRFGRRNVLWVMILCMGLGLAATLVAPLAAIVAGVALFTFGFFGAHATASGWVSRRAGQRRALVAGFYLSSYYIGGSVLGSLSGLAWDRSGWAGVVAGLGVAVAAVFLVALRLRRLPAAAGSP